MVDLEIGQTYVMANGVPVEMIRVWADPERLEGIDPEFWFIGQYQIAPHLPVNTTMYFPDGRHWTENPEFPLAINFTAKLNDGWT